MPTERTQSQVKSCDKPVIFHVNPSIRELTGKTLLLSEGTWLKKKKWMNRMKEKKKKNVIEILNRALP